MKLKIYCGKCKGIGEIVPKVQNGKQFDYGNPYKCPSCKGQGYTELDPYAELKEEMKDEIKLSENILNKIYNSVWENSKVECEVQKTVFEYVLERIEEQEKKL